MRKNFWHLTLDHYIQSYHEQLIRIYDKVLGFDSFYSLPELVYHFKNHLVALGHNSQLADWGPALLVFFKHFHMSNHFFEWRFADSLQSFILANPHLISLVTI